MTAGLCGHHCTLCVVVHTVDEGECAQHLILECSVHFANGALALSVLESLHKIHAMHVTARKSQAAPAFICSTIAAVTVAMPLMRCVKLRAMRSAIKIDLALPFTVPNLVPDVT